MGQTTNRDEPAWQEHLEVFLDNAKKGNWNDTPRGDLHEAISYFISCFGDNSYKPWMSIVSDDEFTDLEGFLQDWSGPMLDELLERINEVHDENELAPVSNIRELGAKEIGEQLLEILEDETDYCSASFTSRLVVLKLMTKESESFYIGVQYVERSNFEPDIFYSAVTPESDLKDYEKSFFGDKLTLSEVLSLLPEELGKKFLEKVLSNPDEQK